MNVIMKPTVLPDFTYTCSAAQWDESRILINPIVKIPVRITNYVVILSHLKCEYSVLPLQIGSLTQNWKPPIVQVSSPSWKPSWPLRVASNYPNTFSTNNATLFRFPRSEAYKSSLWPKYMEIFIFCLFGTLLHWYLHALTIPEYLISDKAECTAHLVLNKLYNFSTAPP